MRQYRTLRVSSIQLAICFFLLCTPAWHQWPSFSQLAYWRSCFTSDQADVRGRKASLFHYFFILLRILRHGRLERASTRWENLRNNGVTLILCNVCKCMTIHIYETVKTLHFTTMFGRQTIYDFYRNSITKTAKLQLFIKKSTNSFKLLLNRCKNRQLYCIYIL